MRDLAKGLLGTSSYLYYSMDVGMIYNGREGGACDCFGCDFIMFFFGVICYLIYRIPCRLGNGL